MKTPEIVEEDEVLATLKERYFKLLKTEDIPRTPSLTLKIDKLEEAISKRKNELL